jgi:phospholipid transport system substrate-binding protein
MDTLKTGARALVGCGTIFVLVLVMSPSTWAGAPTEQLREHVDRVIKILQTPELQGERKATERRAEVRKVANNIFDYSETAKRSLGRHWQDRTPAERSEFTQLFADLLEHAYFSRIDRYSGENMKYVGESVEGDQGTIRTRIFTKQGSEIPVDYRLFRQGTRWRVYDVVIEGVSLISNYRTQFNKIIRTSSFNDLLAKMKAKEFSSPDGTKARQG